VQIIVAKDSAAHCNAGSFPPTPVVSGLFWLCGFYVVAFGSCHPMLAHKALLEQKGGLSTKQNYLTNDFLTSYLISFNIS
jgi:hypothetical protein